jgi:hypothetical protein
MSIALGLIKAADALISPVVAWTLRNQCRSQPFALSGLRQVAAYKGVRDQAPNDYPVISQRYLQAVSNHTQPKRIQYAFYLHPSL